MLPANMGRDIRSSFRPCLRTLWVGLAKSGQRRAEGPPLGWIKFGPDFLCRSRLTQTTLGAIRKATGICRHLVISITKIIDWSSLVGEARISGETEPSRSRAPEKIAARRKGGGVAANPRRVGRVTGNATKPVLQGMQNLSQGNDPESPIPRGCETDLRAMKEARDTNR
jgi:hypothetical protein